VKRFALRVALACVSALAVGAGVALATGAIANPFVAANGTITACVQRASGVTKIVRPGEVCQASDEAVTWNQVGPKGPKGDTGATGADGAAGAPGAPGPSFLGSACTIPGGSSGTVTETVAPTGAISLTCGTSGGQPPIGGGGGGGGGGVGIGGSPQPEVCNGIDDDNDGVVDDHLTDVPSLANATAACGSNGWRIAACDPGFADADGIVSDGCEFRVS
jgi:hypothetical protein